MNFLSNWPRLCESPLWLLLSSSSSNNIQDQCLIITDFYGVQEKGCVAGEKKSKNLIPNPNTVTGLPVADVELLAGKMLFQAPVTEDLQPRHTKCSTLQKTKTQPTQPNANFVSSFSLQLYLGKSERTPKSQQHPFISYLVHVHTVTNPFTISTEL